MATVQLDDKYALAEGSVFMTGVQALVRLPLEQARRDRAAGLKIGTFISGYPGSPLGGYDLALMQARRFLDPLDIHFVPGLNEELAAANVWGSQMTEVFHSPYDGVTGIWYGKSPGVDRCLDIFKHANLGGGPRHSAMLALAADDPQAKSSTLPNNSEWDFVACGMPVLFPASVSEFLELGLHGIALSRLTGVWVGFKAVTNLCDGGASVRVGPELPRIVTPELPGFQKPHSFIFFAPGSIELEQHLYEQRFPAIHAYARSNHLDRIVQLGRRDRLGIVAAGKAFSDVVQALADMGLGDAQLAEHGIRLLKLGLVYPLEPGIVREFAEGLDEILVVEEKRDLVEGQLRNILYPLDRRPRVLGKRDEEGRPLFPIQGELDADLVAERLGPRLLRLPSRLPGVSRRLSELEAVRGRQYQEFSRRTPNYCPGCPHSRSTVSLDGQLVGGGIGCHGMAPMMTQEERQTINAAPMGAEGSAFIGLAPFVEAEHFIQNVGDGTFFHSASQSLRATVAAGINITFKLLYNGHVAMTGGQHATGSHSVPTLARFLDAEGVAGTIIVSENVGNYQGVEFPANTKLYPRERYEDAVRELRGIPGTTVLLFDQECAAEKRRARKRGKLPEPQKYAFINEEVCEGCGDCGDVSNCMSVQPVETELGRKTQIHQASCNKDYSCTRGDCPSFVTVYTSKGLVRPQPVELASGGVPEPASRVQVPADGYHVYMPGIGGTGVVTANQVLAYAALLDGLQVHSLDQTGLAQKGGAVLSSLVILEGEQRPYWSNKVGMARADLMLALDVLGAVAALNADRMSPARTVVVGDATVQPTAEVVRHVELLMPGRSALQRAVDRFSREQDNLWVEAGRTAEALFGNQMLTNTFMLGVAYQAGLLPVSAASLEEAVRMNGVQVEPNLQAFRYGRLLRHDPAALAALQGQPRRDFEAERGRYLKVLGASGPAYERLLARSGALPEDLRRQLALRLGELIQYQDVAYAERYLEEVLALWAREQEVLPGRSDLTEAGLRQLYKLMAYKDEYEVARLLLKGEWGERICATFIEPKLKYNLHPPFLREHGLKHKLELGGWFRPVLAALIPLRRLRGTGWDPFGRAEARRIERGLVAWYMAVLERIRTDLTARNHHSALAAASAPDRIRGYEQIKLRSVQPTRDYVERRLAEMRELAVTA